MPHEEDRLIEEAAETAAEECDPITDQRAPAPYRREMVMVWTGHVAREAFKKACGKKAERR